MVSGRGILGALVGTLLLILAAPGLPPVHAATTITVTSAANAGSCPSATTCTLRGALAVAQDGDTIQFNVANTDPIVIPLQSTLAVSKSVTIKGPGATHLIVDGQQTVSGFSVAANTTVIFDGITIRNGGAVATGGGIVIGNATVTVTNSILDHNAALAGGALFNVGTLTVTNSTLSGNSATGTDGGGIYNIGTLSVTNSTLSGNSATGHNGGGIFNASTLNLTHSTLSGNTALLGGGLFLGGTTNNVLSSIIVASTSGGNCSRLVPSSNDLGNNLSDTTACFAGTANGDIVTSTPGLGPLALHAPDTTPSHALLVGSPAIDGVTFNANYCGSASTGGITTDQHGIPRPTGPRCDIGAVERSIGMIQFSAPTYSASESHPGAAITINRIAGFEGPVGATLMLSNGTATAPDDYSDSPLAVNFADGEASKTVNVPIVNDGLIETSETVNLTLALPTGGASIGAPSTALLTILDDDVPTPTPTLTPTSTSTATPTATTTLSATSTPASGAAATPTAAPPQALGASASTPTVTPTATVAATTATVAASATPTATATPEPVTVTVIHAGENRLAVTVTANGAGAKLLTVAWTPTPQFSVEDAAGTLLTGGLLKLPGNSSTATFYVRRLSGTGVTVPLTITGSFGTWSTFVGGGSNAW